MLRHFLGKFRPTPSMTVSLLALVVALGSAGFAANGGAFILGATNSATLRTYLGANFNGNALQIANSSTGTSATALQLTVAANHAPMKVNSTKKVVNLNADMIDGLHSTALTKAVRVSYNLEAGEVSGLISVPENRPVQLVGVNLTSGNQGVGQTSLLSIPDYYIGWVGLNSFGAATITSGLSPTHGTRIVHIDNQSKVFVEVGSAVGIKVRNTAATRQSGRVTLMW